MIPVNDRASVVKISKFARVNPQYACQVIATSGGFDVYNAYFNSHCSQSYSLKRNLTSGRITIEMKVPKWLQNAVKQTVEKESVLFYSQMNDNLFCMVVHPWHMSIQTNWQLEGISFIANYEFIKIKDQIDNLYRRFVTYYKTMSSVKRAELGYRASAQSNVTTDFLDKFFNDYGFNLVDDETPCIDITRYLL